MTASELLERLLAATPPPPAGVELDELIAAALRVTSAREAVLVMATPVRVATPIERAMQAELAARHRAWDTSLAAARDQLGQHRLGASKLRAYGRAR